MNSPLSLHSTLASPTVPATGEPRLVYLLLEVRGGEGAQPLPANIALVLDCSESMRIRLVSEEQFIDLIQRGQAREVITDGVPAWQIDAVSNDLVSKLPRKIDYVADALGIVNELLRPEDYFSLVCFASQAVTLIPQSRGTERARLHQAAQQLEYLNLGNETEMASGIGLAFDEMHRLPSENQASRIILLTDGHTKNVSACYDWARRAREGGFTLTTMGMGSEFNEDLLIPLADMTGGSAYYIEKPDHLPAAFRKELGAATRVGYRSLEVKLSAPAGVELKSAHRVLPELGVLEWEPNGGNSYRLILGSYNSTAPAALLLELSIPGWTAGSYRAAQAILTWESPAGRGTRPYQSQDILLQVASSTSEHYDPRVIRFMEKVSAYKVGRQAVQDAQSGDPRTGALRLRKAAARLREMDEPGLANALVEQAAVLERGQNMDANSTKKIQYETRRLTQRLGE